MVEDRVSACEKNQFGPEVLSIVNTPDTLFFISKSASPPHSMPLLYQ